MRISATVHPPSGRNQRKDPSDLNASEIVSTNLVGLPIMVEHQRPQVGEVLSQYTPTYGREAGSLKVEGLLHDPETMNRVRSGELLGMSLGTEVLRQGGDVLSRRQEEVSVCAQPARMGCWIDHVDGRRVAEHHVASARSTTSGTPDPHPSVRRYR